MVSVAFYPLFFVWREMMEHEVTENPEDQGALIMKNIIIGG